ncbi:hypothetical protein MRBLMN1_002432 [Chitinophaga ginsengisegetis]|uniref:hypothetical protein n=1 Tax=Chitinophaga ginsengisegetis TaxID=393003 RepID=UPI003428D86E
MKQHIFPAFTAAIILFFVTGNCFAQQADSVKQAQFLALIKKAAVTLRNEKADAKKLQKAEAAMKATQDIYYKRRDSLQQADDSPQPVYDANSVDLGAVVMTDLAAKEDTSKEHKDYLAALLTRNTLTIIHIFGKEAGQDTWLLLAKKLNYEGKDYAQYLQAFSYSDKTKDAYIKVIKSSLLDLAKEEAKKRSDY